MKRHLSYVIILANIFINGKKNVERMNERMDMKKAETKSICNLMHVLVAHFVSASLYRYNFGIIFTGMSLKNYTVFPIS